MKKLLLPLLICLFYACDTEDTPFDELEYSKYKSNTSVDEEILFMPVENYDSNETQTPVLSLKLETAEIFPCYNFGIATTQFTLGNELIIRLEKISKSTLCLTALGPARAQIDLPESVEKLTFINGNRIDQYDVTISEEKVSIKALKDSFTQSLYSNTFRLPENSFAFVCGTNTDNQHTYNDFLNILKANPNLQEFNFEGEGRIPYPESSDGHWVNHPSKYFKYTSTEVFNDLSDVLATFTSANIQKNSGVSIALYGWNNSKHYSWIDN
ncbi:hypothetical protein [Roseivirga pacifica]